MRVAVVAAVVALVLVTAVSAAGGSGVSGSDTITTIAGRSGTQLVRGFSGDGGPATSALLFFPDDVAVDGQGNVYIADTGNSRVRKVSACGTITTIAGTGTAGFSGDGGPATAAQLNDPDGVAVDGQGNVYIADNKNLRVRKVSVGGTITTIAGGGNPGLPGGGDGYPATSVWLDGVFGVAVDAQGNIYISTYDRIRKVSPGGAITTIADGYVGQGVAVDGQGNVYFSERYTRTVRVRKEGPGGTITTIAGTPTSGTAYRDGMPATEAQLELPVGVAVDGQGDVYIRDAESQNGADFGHVYKVSGGTITVVAGNGRLGESGDGGPARSASFVFSLSGSGLAVDSRGNLYIVDGAASRVRAVWKASGAAAPKLTLGGASTQRLLAQQGITITANCNQPCSLSAGGVVTILGTSYVFDLATTSATLATPFCTSALRLRFPAAAQKRYRLLLRPGQQAQARITVHVKGLAHHTSTKTRTVTVQP